MTYRTAANRLGMATGGALLIAGMAAAPALAYPPGTALAVSGANGVVTVSNAQPGCLVTVTVNGSGVGSATVGNDGTATINTSTPAGASLDAMQSGQGCTAESAEATVGGGGGGGGGGGDTPARTGSNTALGLMAGIGALGVGGGLVVASRRKKA